MRILKLLVLAGLVYLIYELYEGFSSSPRATAKRDEQRDLHRALNRDEGRMSNLTGPGRGEEVETHDSTGGSIKHRVGRGVVRS